MHEDVQEYLSQGLIVFPVEYGSKQASIPNWQDPKRIWKAEDFPSETNIALRLDTIADIDADNPFARLLCQKWLFTLLATKTAMFGRPSMGVPTHYLFTTAGPISPLAISDDDGMVIEIRHGSSMYSMAPPSKLNASDTKPEDVLVWMSADKILATVAPDHLTLVVKVIGTIAILAKFWPKAERHNTMGAITGMLCRLLPQSLLDNEADIMRLCEEAAILAGDTEKADRTKYVKHTYQRWIKNEPTRGGPWLQKHGHERLVELLYQVWDYHGDTKYVDELNDEHAVVHMKGGAVRVLSERIYDDDVFISYTKLHEFPRLFTEKVTVGLSKSGLPILKNVGEAWLEHPRRRQYKGVEMAPNPDHASPGYYNLWRGFKVEPAQGDWSLFEQHLMLVANHDPEHFQFIFNWMAETVQHPERQIGVALAYRGLQGTGKSTFCRWFGQLFATHFLHIDSEHHLTGNFNAHLHDKIVVLADEAVWAGGKAGLGALKRLVTEPTLNIERKGIDMETVRNRLHVMIASNEEWVVPAGWDNRRFAVFDVANTHINDKKFFRAVHDQLVHGGWAALLYDLLLHKVDIDFTEIPKTKALRDQQIQTANFEEEWWLEKLREGSLGAGVVSSPSDAMDKEENEHDVEVIEDGYVKIIKDVKWPSVVLKERVHNDYIAFLDKHHRMSRNTRGTQSKLGLFLNQHTPLDSHRKSNNEYYWSVPTLQKCRANWTKTHQVSDDLWTLPEKPEGVKEN